MLSCQLAVNRHCKLLFYITLSITYLGYFHCGSTLALYWSAGRLLRHTCSPCISGSLTSIKSSSHILLISRLGLFDDYLYVRDDFLLWSSEFNGPLILWSLQIRSNIGKSERKAHCGIKLVECPQETSLRNGSEPIPGLGLQDNKNLKDIS